MVEIAKALSKNARVLIMDEPTSSLSETETQSLFRIARRLKESGISIVYISHRMSEIFTICDRVTVMRDGQTVLTDACRNVGMDGLIEAMLGLRLGRLSDLSRARARTEREARPRSGGARRRHRVRGASFSVAAGEIVGLAGLMGSGRTEIAEAIFGVRPIGAGSVRIDGKPVTSTAEAMASGVALVPEDRRRQGLVLEHTVHDNFMLPSLQRFGRGLFVRDREAANEGEAAVRDLKIRTDGLGRSCGSCRAATSRRWCWRNGWPATRVS